jgi:SOS-response transcriptional repressor LexA
VAWAFLDCGDAIGVEYARMDYVDWIRDALDNKKLSKTRKGLAKALGIDPSQVTRILDRSRRIQLHELRTIADYLGVPPPATESSQELIREEISHRKVPILGDVAAGVWLEVSVFNNEVEPSEFLPYVPIDLQNDPGVFALRVRGTSMNKIAPDGALLVCVLNHHSGKDLDPGQVIIAERRDPDGTFEVTVKRVRRGLTGKIELWPESTDPKYQAPLVLDESLGEGVEVHVMGRVRHIVIPV